MCELGVLQSSDEATPDGREAGECPHVIPAGQVGHVRVERAALDPLHLHDRPGRAVYRDRVVDPGRARDAIGETATGEVPRERGVPLAAWGVILDREAQSRVEPTHTAFGDT